MYTEYNQKRAKTANFRLKNSEKQYHPAQTNNFRDIYINQSPTFYNQYRYKPEDEEEEEEYMHKFQYIHNKKKPAEYYNKNKEFQRTMKNLNIKPDYFLNEFNSIKDSVEREHEKTFLKKAVKTYTNQSPNKKGEQYYIINNVKKSEDFNNERKIMNYREYGHQSYEGYNKPQKFIRNGPLPQKKNFNTEINIARSQSYLEPVAQKICNIVIKAEPKKDKDKKLKSDKKTKKEGFTKNIQIEENVAQGSAIPYKKININNKKDSKPKLSLEENIYEDNNENINNNLKKEKDMNNDKNINNEKEILRNKAKENNKEKDIRDIRGHKEEIDDEDEQVEGNIQGIENEEEIEDGQEQIEDEQIDQEEIEQLEDEDEDNNNKKDQYENDEENNGINKEEIEELEEEEQHQIQLSNNIKDKQIYYKLQKENEINLIGIKANKPIMKIEKFSYFKKGNNIIQKHKKNYSRLRIIRDNKIQIKGIKKNNNSIFVINKESKVELLKKENKPNIEIERVQSIQQYSRIKPKNIYKKRQIFKITKNRDNNVNIISENRSKEHILEMQKVQNFEQPRNKKRKPIIKNKNLKFKISKIKDANFILEKIEEKLFIMENVQSHEQIQNKKAKNKIKNKYIKFKINKIKDANFMLEKIEPVTELKIENAEIFEQVQNKKIKNKKKNVNIKFKISKIKDANFMLEKIEEEPELKIDNAGVYQQIQNKKKPNTKKNNLNKIKISKIKDANFIIEKIEEEPELQIENVHNHEQIQNKPSKKKVKNKFIKFKICKIKDGNFEIISIPDLSIIKEKTIELQKKYNKKIYKKSNYKKYKQSKRSIYQYLPLQIINDAIISPKDSRFILKGKPKKFQPKIRNIVKKEITYFYKSPLPQKKPELSIGGTINNTINPTKPKANDNIIVRSRKMSSSSTSNPNNKGNIYNIHVNKQSNISDTKEKEKENDNSYKTTIIVSSNLVSRPKNENEPKAKKVEPYQSIRRKYAGSKSNQNIFININDNNKNNDDISNNNDDNNSISNNNKNTNSRYNIRSKVYPQSSNNSSREKNIKTESSTNVTKKNKIIDIISPIRDKKENIEKNKNQNDKDNKQSGKYFATSRYVKKDEKENNDTKNKTYISIKTDSNINYSNKNEIPRTPINSHSNNNTYNRLKNKSHTITIVSDKQEAKNMGRTYISSNKLSQRNQSNEIKLEDKNNSNVGRIYISTTNSRKKDENNNNSSNNANTLYISTNLKKESDKKEIINTNVFYSSFTKKKSVPKQFIDNNKMFISSRGASNSKKNSENQNETKTSLNINRIVVNSSTNSPLSSKAKEKEQVKEKIVVISNDEQNKKIQIFENMENKDNEKEKENKVDNNNNEEVIDISVKKEEKDDKKDEIPVEENKKEIENKNIEAENKIEDKNSTEKYNFEEKYELSDITKSYLNNYMSGNRPELSDFSKQFLSQNYVSDSTSRPELSNITRAYLISQSPISENEDEK